MIGVHGLVVPVQRYESFAEVVVRLAPALAVVECLVERGGAGECGDDIVEPVQGPHRAGQVEQRGRLHERSAVVPHELGGALVRGGGFLVELRIQQDLAEPVAGEGFLVLVARLPVAEHGTPSGGDGVALPSGGGQGIAQPAQRLALTLPVAVLAVERRRAFADGDGLRVPPVALQTSTEVDQGERLLGAVAQLPVELGGAAARDHGLREPACLAEV